MAVQGPHHEHARLISFVIVTRPADRKYSVWSGTKGDLIQKLIPFGIDHIDAGGYLRSCRRIAAISQVVPPALGIHPTDIKSNQTIRNANSVYQLVRGQLVFVRTGRVQSWTQS